VRKTIAFSKKRERLKQQLHLAFAYYHFVKPHRKGKRQKEKIPKSHSYDGGWHYRSHLDNARTLFQSRFGAAQEKAVAVSSP
jgi:cephalosporin-C deacetylase-like acetyl esterase